MSKKSPNKKKASAKKPAKPLKKPIKKTVKKPAKKVTKKKGKKREDLNCFISTACVNYHALPDNGYELNTLRKFRDEHMLKDDEGKNLVRHYYHIAPTIVELLNKDRNKDAVYKWVFKNVKQACASIELKEYKKARTVYTNMVSVLMEKFKLV